MYAYILEKARLYLKMKPEIYRKNDALGKPDPELSDTELKLLETACRQLLEGQGKSADNPITDIGIRGFYLLMDLFHFEVTMQSLIHSADDKMIDRMNCEHMVTGGKLVLYNHVYNKYLEDFKIAD